MHDLEVPDALSGSRIEAEHGLAEQVFAFAPPAVPVVARRPHGQVEQATRAVDGERCPDIRVARVFPRAIFPRVVAVLAGARHRPESPDALARARIEGLDVTRRVLAIHQSIADTVPENHEV